MRSRLGELDEQLAGDVLLYLIAGSGLQYIKIEKWTLNYRSKLDNIFLAWRGNRTQQDMYHFVFVENGYTCYEVDFLCLVDDYYQKEYDEIGKLHIYLKQVTEARLIRNAINELVIYLGSSTVEIGPFPRIFLNYDHWNRFVFKQKRISMLNEKQCFASHNKGKKEKTACLVRKWIKKKVVNILNCTLPPFNEILPYLANITVCEPAKVAQSYEHITAPITEEFNCLPTCERIENQWSLQSSKIRGPSPRNYSYEVEASFGELQYEEYREIRLTTTLNFLSELGGQLGLFVGSSSLTYVQLLLSIAIYAYDLAKRTLLEHTVPMTRH
ncbi:unnamed protein product [Cylicocyclus nassatus]|uniref:Uncharacterized protein n=1 Tax=Cylicocyclus nassatus TaxID=53992 RepID=A0AA36GZD7_CYLNA|nr:unnamed protein product [Cylicocyclus nassatus]